MRAIRLVLAGAALTLVTMGSARAETAVGAVFGYPGNVGLSMRFDRTPIGVAWSSDFIHGTMDVWFKKTRMKDGEGKLSWYYGPGIDAGIPLEDTKEFFLAGRVPVGLQFMASPKLELFGELAPGLQVLDTVDFYWASSVGVRLVLGK